MTIETPAETGHVSTPASEQPATIASDNPALGAEPNPASQPGGISSAFAKAKDRLNGAAQMQQTDPASASSSVAAELAIQPEQPAPKPLKAPDRWTAEQKDAFGKQPREIQEAWLSQHKAWETGFNKRFEETAGARKFAEEVNAVIPEALRNTMQERGIPPAQAIGRLFELYQISEANPAQYIANFMKAKGIDPRVFLPQQGENGQQQPDPAQQLAPLIQPLLNEIAQLKQGQTAWQQHLQSERDKQNEAAIAAFAGDKDATGASKFPHLEHVAERMAELIETDPRYARMDPRQRLEEAYHHAVLSDPTLRSELVSAEAARRADAIEKERLNARLNSAASAKPAASSSIPSPRPTGMKAAFDLAKKQVRAGF